MRTPSNGKGKTMPKLGKPWSELPIVESLGNWLWNLAIHFVFDQWKLTDPEGWKAANWFYKEDRVKFRMGIIAVGQGISLIVRALPLERIPLVKQLKDVVDELIEQTPDAAGEYFARQRVDFEEGYQPKVSAADLFKGCSDWVQANVKSLGGKFTALVRKRIPEFPTWALDRVFPRDKEKSPALDRHFAAVRMLESSERRAWGLWVAGLNPRGQEILHEMLESLSTPDAIRLVLEQKKAQRLQFLRSYTKEGPVEDFFQGMGQALNPHLDAANRALRRELRKFR